MASIASNRQSQQDTSAASHQYTCNTCQVAFRYADTQKGHMKSDWHRYNLKRRVASLPPISSEVFTEKVIQARAATSAEADRAGFQQLCEVCQRTYYSENSYRNHIGSQKHKAKEAALLRRGGVVDDASSVMSSTMSLGEPIATPSEDVGSDAEEEFNEVVEGLQKTSLMERPSPIKRTSHPVPSAGAQAEQAQPTVSGQASEAGSGSATPVPGLTLKHCLFCNYQSPTIPLNLVHMERIHGMFIPEKQYLVDLEGLLTALQQRIQEYHECLYCGKYKSTAEAAQTHMRDKGHCMIPFTTEEEQLMIGDFYDFRSTYSDAEDSEDESADEKPNGGAKLGAKRSSKAVGEDGDEIMDDDGWETDSSASSCASEDLQSIPVDHHYRQYERLEKHPHHSSRDPRHHHQKDGWHSHAHKHRAIFYDDTELHLPSGRAVGHRSMARYYRQNLHNYPTAEERVERLALEATGDSDDEGERGRRQVARRQPGGKFGAVVSRANGGSGMTGVTEQKKKELERAVPRSVKQQQRREKRNEWLLNRRNNHQEHYNYQIL
ncbi:C2H2 type zinc-finger-domain-containing protein [Xylariaceae sp. FL0594]|nr:C2H2 type zinc-finger-domain-containing protein [Xylariaceae sp. FL0594]